MNYSLVDHNLGYQISSKDILFSAAMGFSGATFAVRHHQLSLLEENPSFGHRLICLAEFVPLIGFVVAIVEKVVCNVFLSGHSNVPWRNESLSADEAMDRMESNARRCFEDHGKKNTNLAERVTNWDQTTPEPLHFTHQVADAKGPRDQMEDAHFYKELDGGIMAGVFDGHGGKEVSAFASEKFQEYFPKILEAEGNVHSAFEKAIHHIHQDVVKNSSWNAMGSTAVVSYIDTAKQRVYTATLGDSEATIYRKVNLGLSVQAIPLSIVSDWKSDINRLANAFGARLVSQWVRYVNFQTKAIRSHLFEGVNVSRAIGDVKETGSPLRPLVIHKPEITVSKISKGDKLVLACDGLYDFLPEDEIKSVIRSSPKDSVATDLMKAALGKMDSKHNDNVTVLAIDVS